MGQPADNVEAAPAGGASATAAVRFPKIGEWVAAAQMAAAWSLPVSIVVFVIGAVVIGAAGFRLVRLIDGLADRTGLGEAFFGMALLGAIPRCRGSCCRSLRR